jgi:hypothetical protein
VGLNRDGVFTVSESGQPRKVSDFVQGAKGIFWVAMAIQAKCHAQMLGVRNFFHLVDPAVACYATYATIYMYGVIKVSIVWHFMNTSPRYCGTLSEYAVVICVFSLA